MIISIKILIISIRILVNLTRKFWFWFLTRISVNSIKHFSQCSIWIYLILFPSRLFQKRRSFIYIYCNLYLRTCLGNRINRKPTEFEISRFIRILAEDICRDNYLQIFKMLYWQNLLLYFIAKFATNFIIFIYLASRGKSL